MADKKPGLYKPPRYPYDWGVNIIEPALGILAAIIIGGLLGGYVIVPLVRWIL